MKNILVYLFFLILFIAPKLSAQQHELFIEKNSESLNAWASNYFPAVNEPVTIYIEFKSDRDYKSDYFSLGFAIDNNIELISGENWYKKGAKKNEIIKMEATIKFKEKTVIDVTAMFGRNIYASLSFYVENSYRESNQVRYMREYIPAFKNYIEKMKNEGSILQAPGLPVDLYDERSSEQYIFIKSEYDRINLKSMQEKNLEVFKKLKGEIDSLTVIEETIIETIMQKEKGQDTLKEKDGFQWEAKKKKSTILPLE